MSIIVNILQDELDNLCTDIEVKMLSGKTLATVNTSNIFLCSIAECWHRIRVLEISDEDAYCMCIDNGDFEWLQLDEIFVCDDEFLRLPAQAFQISMYGLEDFAKNPNSKAHIDQLVQRSFIGETISRDDEQRNGGEAPIKMVLYDTSGDEDVNLNQTILGKIISSTPQPKLKPNEVNSVMITHIDDYIHCQLVESSSDSQNTSSGYIQQLINNLVKSDFSKDDYRGLYADKKDAKGLYLVYDEPRKIWCRAQRVQSNANGSCLMHLVDLGSHEDIELKNIYRLDKISTALFLYPAQSLKFALANVKMTEDVRKKLRAYLPENKEALVITDCE